MNFISLGFDELRNVVRFLSFQDDDNEDVGNNDILGNGKIKEKEKAMVHETVPKRLEVAVDVVDNKEGDRRRSVRRSSFRNKEKRKRLQRLASMPGINHNSTIVINIKEVIRNFQIISKYIFIQNLIEGDTELNEYMDSLAREPERLTTPHNTDTGETILHLLAKV